MVLMGQFHVAPAHLPAAVDEKLGSAQRKALIVYQNAEGVWWKLAERGLAHRAPAVELDARTLCLVNASPIVCQRSFLDYVEAEAGDQPMEEQGIASSVKLCARHIGKWVGINVNRQLKDLDIVTLRDWAIIERIAKRATFDKAELRQLEKHVLSGESAFIPRARTIWLASLSANHAAEEATHFIRHCTIGDAMEREQSRAEAFWVRCLEEALGFFGSKLLNPARQCTSLAGWKALFADGTDEQRRIAAFVLAISASESEGPEALSRLLPLRNDTLFHAVSHALGYLLGDQLYRAVSGGELSQTQVRAMFRDPLLHPLQSWRAWKSMLSSKRAHRRAA